MLFEGHIKILTNEKQTLLAFYGKWTSFYSTFLLYWSTFKLLYTTFSFIHTWTFFFYIQVLSIYHSHSNKCIPEQVQVQYLNQGYLSTQIGGARNWKTNSQLVEELLYLLSHYCYIYMKKFYVYNKTVKSFCFQTYSFYFECFWRNWSVRFKPCMNLVAWLKTCSWQNHDKIDLLFSRCSRYLKGVSAAIAANDSLAHKVRTTFTHTNTHTQA